MILEFYGHLAARKTSTRAELTSLAVDCVLACHTKLIIIDDLHFVDFRRQNGQALSSHLEGLANHLPVMFLSVATVRNCPGGSCVALRGEPQPCDDRPGRYRLLVDVV
ncbi:MAG: hypothetical protein WBG36_12760 [Ornithinimicrobium sp.]